MSNVVTLEWEDRVGYIRRTLPVGTRCPQCGSRAHRRIDVRKRCLNAVFTPVECLRCVPLSWYAWHGMGEPAGPVERPSLFQRVRRFFTGPGTA
jgi:hypothetical protein